MSALKFPFRLLGRSKDGTYAFLAEDTGTIVQLSKSQFNKNSFFDLAPMDFWLQKYPRTRFDKSTQSDEIIGFDIDVAIDHLMQESKKIKYSIGKYRAAGFWNDAGRIVYNSGDKNLFELTRSSNGIVDIKKWKYNEFPSDYYYMVSDRNFPIPYVFNDANFDITRIATKEDGEKLERLFLAQSFNTEFEAKYLMGWSLIAPFGTLLKWRPHVWLSGMKERGKSWLFENIIAPMGCGTEYCAGSGTTYAALRRSLGENGGFAIIDEMDSRNIKIKEKIDDIIELVKNASSDTSGISELVINGHPETFTVNQMFLLVAIIPVLEGAAIESRVINVVLDSKANLNEKIKLTNEILADGFFEDKRKFFNSTFYSLHKIFDSMKVIHDIIKDKTNSSRKADNIAPPMAAYWHAKNKDIISKIEAEKIALEYLSFIGLNEKADDDFDTFFHVLFNALVRVGIEDVLISDLILTSAGSQGSKDALKKVGIRMDGILTIDGTHISADGTISISTKSEKIKDIMLKAGTYFAFNYANVLKEHPAFIKGESIRIGHSTYSCKMDLKKLAEMYFYTGEMSMNEVPF